AVQLELLKDVNGANLKDTIGKEFVQLLSHMLVLDPIQRYSADRLLHHHIFANPNTEQISHIPVAYAGELGLNVDDQNLNGKK
ncbi:MAG: hypothetical protein EZS28_036026, partial [Streblomastix strix]